MHNQVVKASAQSVQVCNPLVYLGQMLAGACAERVEVIALMVRQLEQGSYLLKRKTKIARATDEPDARKIMLAVSAIVSPRPRRLRKESNTLVIDDGVGLDADGFCQRTDGVLGPLIRLRLNRLNRGCLVT